MHMTPDDMYQAIMARWYADGAEVSLRRISEQMADLLAALEQSVQLLDNIDGRSLANGVILSYTQDLPGFRAAIANARYLKEGRKRQCRRHGKHISTNAN